jgi:hypothetical protein
MNDAMLMIVAPPVKGKLTRAGQGRQVTLRFGMFSQLLCNTAVDRLDLARYAEWPSSAEDHEAQRIAGRLTTPSTDNHG